MSMSVGTQVYDVDAPPVVARGVSYDDTELKEALTGSVAHILQDTSGKSELDAMLAGVATTEFAQANLKEALERIPPVRNWQVGEALAEAYLTEHSGCSFPWPSSRDLRTPQASPAGADLVGFQEMDSETSGPRFAFGEVKTSNEERYPPNTMYGRHGMVNQIERLRDSRNAKDALFLYLGHHAINAEWKSLYQSAAARYLQDPDDVALFGVLVRDVEPRSEDLDSRAKSLANGCPAKTSIELWALYFPRNSINTLAERVRRPMEGGNADN